MAPMETWKRTLDKPLSAVWRNGGSVQERPSFDTLRGDQVTTSFRTHGTKDVIPEEALSTRVTYNPFTGAGQSRIEGDFKDTGHEFYSLKRETRLSHPHTYTRNPSTGDFYRGPLILGKFGSPMDFPTVNKMSQNDIKFYGSKAIRATVPTEPSANVAQMIGELVSDGLPISGPAVMRLYDRLQNVRKLTPKKSALGHKASLRDFVTGVGDGSLALQFGFEPIVRDLADVMFAVSTAARRIEQWYRDSGRQVRRTMRFPQAQSTSVGTLSGSPFLAGPFYGSGSDRLVQSGFVGPITIEQRTFTDTWFSGAYMYFATVGETVLEKIMQYGREADLILGLKPTSELLWELAPWSWLIDWKVNVGDGIANMTRFSADKLVLRYGYLMRKTSVTTIYTANGMRFYDSSPGPVSRQLSVVQKERYKATPYGFALNPNDFSSAQWQILTSLGLSKGGKVLP